MSLHALKRALVGSLGPAGLYFAARTLSKRHPRILMYHRFSDHSTRGKVTARILGRQITEIRKNYRICPLSEIVDCLARHKSVPGNAIVFTIDDGYLDFYRYAYPVLKYHNVPATIYLTSQFINGDIWLWPDKIKYLLSVTREKQLSIFVNEETLFFRLESDWDKYIAWQMLNDHCLGMAPIRRDNMIKILSQVLNIEIPLYPTTEYSAMNWKQVKELTNVGIEIGCHTKTHPILSTLDENSLLDEIEGSKQEIASNINMPVTSFCYPNGEKKDYTEDIKNMVRGSGFTSAVVAYHDKYALSDCYEIRRYGVSQDEYQYRNVIHGVEYIKDLFM